MPRNHICNKPLYIEPLGLNDRRHLDGGVTSKASILIHFSSTVSNLDAVNHGYRRSASRPCFEDQWKVIIRSGEKRHESKRDVEPVRVCRCGDLNSSARVESFAGQDDPGEGRRRSGFASWTMHQGIVFHGADQECRKPSSKRVLCLQISITPEVS